MITLPELEVEAHVLALDKLLLFLGVNIEVWIDLLQPRVIESLDRR